ncbi:hypothetical protein RvY_08818 [Ramazzottius varieornatus]|uniref:Uncharacterized protein n=1 Tax=Ramazzottius varieornatus TaxID=947166 RepID=A0A1D1VF65_RAMVA|nr:hypothetical protein RvY_08818 [Ramazzottius varieornatus]
MPMSDNMGGLTDMVALMLTQAQIDSSNVEACRVKRVFSKLVQALQQQRTLAIQQSNFAMHKEPAPKTIWKIQTEVHS